MQELVTRASLVEYETLEEAAPITAVLARSELEAALDADDSAQLWFDIGSAEDEEITRLTLDLTLADLQEILRFSTADEIVVALDPDGVEGLLAEPEVEAHGLREALAIAVAAGAIAAPAGLAATPQTASPAATAQARAAATSQQVSAAATAQVSSQATRGQVAKGQVAKGQVAKGQVAKGQVAKGQVARTQVSRAQVSRSLVVRAGGVKALGGRLAR
jgi:hypothetical protein